MKKAHIINQMILLVISLGFLWFSPIFSQGETGAQFLGIGIGAKAAAMGEGFSAIADDPSALYWNPAGLAQLNSLEVMASHNFWLLDMTAQYGSVVVPLGKMAVGAGVYLSSSGDIPKYENFEQTGDYSANDFAASLAFAAKFANRFSVGGTAKLLQLSIEEEDASGIAFDLGGQIRLDDNGKLTIGAVFQNLGGDIRFIEASDPLPQTIRGGAAFQTGLLTLSADVVKPKAEDLYVGGGAEILVNNVLAIRGGYSSANSFSAGAGIIWRNIHVSYAYVPYDDLDDSQRISLSLRF